MTRYALNLPIDLKQEAEQIAKKQGVSLNQFIMWSVSEKVATMRQQQLDDPKFPGIAYVRGSASDYAVPVIRGTRIRVQTIAVDIKQGMTPKEIAAEYELDARKIAEAQAFYNAHQSEIDDNIQYENELAEKHEQQFQKAQGKRHGKAKIAS
jgi:uncharacterized protein (DUF433 family)